MTWPSVLLRRNVFEVCDAFVLMQDLFVILGMFVSDRSFESL